MKKISQFILAALCTFAALPNVQASQGRFFTYSPTAGVPWTGGTSSLDWTNWSFADNVLTNNATSNRTWTIPIVFNDNDSTHPATIHSVMANSSTGTTSGQLVANSNTGARTFSLTPVAASSTSLTDTFLGNIVVPVQGTGYVNYIVGKSGGRLARMEIAQTLDLTP